MRDVGFAVFAAYLARRSSPALSAMARRWWCGVGGANAGEEKEDEVEVAVVGCEEGAEVVVWYVWCVGRVCRATKGSCEE